VEIVCADGVFMACPEDVWRNTRFNEELLKGFHFYDIDFSLRIAMKKKVIATNLIDMVHLTKGGDFGDRWMAQAFIFHDGFADKLPYSKANIDAAEADIKVAKYWLDWCKDQPVSFNNRMSWVNKQNLLGKPVLWYSIAKFILYKPLGLKRIHRLFKKNRS
jgi:hypothetical protein